MNITQNTLQPSLFSDAAKTKKFMIVTSLLLLAAFFMLMPEMALAGEAGDNTKDFDSVWTTLKEWTQGSLGRVIAGSMILVGIIGGIARQSIMAFAIGIAGGMGLTYAPDIIETVVSATLENAEAATVAAIQVSNGLGL